MAPEAEKRICAERKPGPLKKPYTTPTLIAHGDALEITKALGGGGTDGQAGSQPGDTVEQ